MASISDTPPSKQHVVAKSVLVVLSLLLLLTAVNVARQLLTSPLPKDGLVTNPVPLALLDATLLTFGSIASLLYVALRLRGIWSTAIVLFQVGIAASILVAVQGAAALVWTPARGEWAGPVNFVILALVVLTPVAVALIGSAAVWCLLVIRPNRQEPVTKWVKLLAIVMSLLLVAAGSVVAIAARNSPAARFRVQEKRVKSGEASVEELIEALQTPGLRFWAIKELEKKGPQAKPAVPALAQLLEDDGYNWLAAPALGAIGPDAAPAIPALVEAIRRERGKRSGTGGDNPSMLSWLAGQALTKIGPAAIPDLIALLAHEDRYVRMTAVSALGGMDPQAQDAVPVLNDVLNDEDETVRQRARTAIDKIENRRPDDDARPNVPKTINKRPETRPPEFNDRRPAVPEDASRVQEMPTGVWTTRAPYAGDPRHRPRGSVGLTFDDGYRWLIAAESVLRWEQRVEGDRKIQSAITATRRYEHVLGTNEVRIIESAATPAAEGVPTVPQDRATGDEPRD